MRRRRRTIVGAVSAVALVAGGVVVATAIGRDRDNERIATFDAASDPTAPVVDTPLSLPASTTPDQPATTVAPSTQPSTTIQAPTTTVVDGGVSPIVGESIPLECGGFRVCTFDHLADGRLVQIGNDGGEAGPPTFTIYDDTATSVDATGLLGNFDASSAFLVDVGPGDIAYVWYTRRDESETARMGAFEITGSEAGRQIIEFDVGLDFSGDTEQVPTRDGFVQVGCCGPDTVRPAPDAEVVIPWVDRDGNEITNDDDTFFSTKFIDQTLTITAQRGDDTRSWAFPDREAGPRGMPLLYELADGRVLYDFEPLHSGGDSSLPIYLDPDGTVDVGQSPGSILHVLPDGRAVLRDLEDQAYALAELAEPAADETDPISPHPESEAATNESTRPLVAITTDGDAVFFDADDANPTLIFDGPAVAESTIGDGPNGAHRVAYSLAEDRVVLSRCCSPIVGQIVTSPIDDLPMPADIVPPTDQMGEPDLVFDGYGYAPALNLDGSMSASIVGDGRAVVVIDAATDRFTNLRMPAEAGDLQDLVWIDDDSIAAIGRAGSVWMLSTLDHTEGVLTIESSLPFGLTNDFDDLVFAGVARDGEIAVHEVGTDTVLSGTIDDYGNNNGDEAGSSLEVITLPGVTTSAWFFDPGQLIWVDTAGTLRVGDRVIAGTYTWARR
ncbi:hypothetical protein YM304_34040 [Ilumatobacter coccineus YM16-304]|uniref:Uncharacterized protein n=2 Tax=Ilumatobacter coccineus TaxID=467094 RepID=A0A6C7EGI8_ILUCY|nr:hypothetical protein YM304_34040 [Ilumatobacter coccineus YM16-304]